MGSTLTSGTRRARTIQQRTHSHKTPLALDDKSGMLRQAQTADSLCGGVREFLQFGCVPSASARTEQQVGKQAQCCFLADGLVWHILKRNKQRTRNVILAPEYMHRKILEAAHSSWLAGHTGVDKTLSRVQSNFWWPGVSADVERFVKNCTRCQEAHLGTLQNTPLQSLAQQENQMKESTWIFSAHSRHSLHLATS